MVGTAGMDEGKKTMTKKFCDICGKELKDCNTHRYRVKEHRFFDVWADVEICWDCFKALRDKHIEGERRDDD